MKIYKHLPLVFIITIVIMFSFIARQIEKRRLKKKIKKEEEERKKKQLEQEREDVMRALHACLEDFNNNRIPNFIVGEREDDQNDQLDKNFNNNNEALNFIVDEREIDQDDYDDLLDDDDSTIYRLEPQINKKQW